MTNTLGTPSNEKRGPLVARACNGRRSDDSSTLPQDSQIATRAYFLWEQRGRPQGSPEADWFRAQEELETSDAELEPVA